HSTLLTLPEIVTVFDISNSAESEWCANAGIAETSTAQRSRVVRFILPIDSPSRFRPYSLHSMRCTDPCHLSTHRYDVARHRQTERVRSGIDSSSGRIGRWCSAEHSTRCTR